MMNTEITPQQKLENIIRSLREQRSIMVSGREDIAMTLRAHPTVFFLEEGRASLRLKSNGYIIADFTAPAVLGLELLCGHEPDTTLAVQDSARLIQVLSSDLAAEIELSGMWHDVFSILADNARHVRDNLAISAFGSNYHIVRHHLLALSNGDGGLLKQESFHRYISERSTVSRSTLYKVIRSLQAGQYITMERGKLIELRHLPKNY
ncbi:MULTISPECIES: helix-turn-helix domain-containing protein [Enterobacter]|uniref:Putative DNA-binding transcriptional regulator n=1 Tax=Enterobacter asburiae TaxID=61645 RepID=A0A217EU21_ENTAS|nr:MULTISPECIES: helix-turn-helix domain-containing protein [Enterobacter]AQZ19802.1 putative DNA-binding transcriptional regulator [Enterobacter asburiae]MDO2456171.1 helix-turn-helix domain-containing protein [Enterobacter asburiae]UAN38729.1 helix-turn-helix domain-containing protein [Enterobacter asburiae]UAN38799.1 helix-turn-helix domain-containing protein [Enterobacter asburiae]UAN43313.1 helix-turn-helix domain-containing protein [Enterobacter sp. JBIWA008]